MKDHSASADARPPSSPAEEAPCPGNWRLNTSRHNRVSRAGESVLRIPAPCERADAGKIGRAHV